MSYLITQPHLTHLNEQIFHKTVRTIYSFDKFNGQRNQQQIKSAWCEYPVNSTKKKTPLPSVRYIQTDYYKKSGKRKEQAGSIGSTRIISLTSSY